jgi:trans-aconitate 2-methyltransferase
MSEQRYAFGHSATAAQRLELVAEVFAQPTRSLLALLPRRNFDLVVDLGCGPGHTTALLAQEIQPERLVGLDISSAFLERAEAKALRAEWHRHDLSEVPFPAGPADLLFARLVLAHLPEPESIVPSWMTQLNPGGYLVLEEDEEILADDPWLQLYEATAAELVASRGGNLYLGRQLSELGGSRSDVVINRVYEQRVPVAMAARMFGMNFAVWRHDALVLDRHPPTELDQLGAALRRMTEEPSGSEVRFLIRQVVLKKSAS